MLTLDQTKVTQGIWTSASPDGFSPSVQILGNGATPGVLQPGESLTIPVYYVGWSNGQLDTTQPIDFSLGVLQSNDTTPIDWASLKSGLQPAGIANGIWDAVYTNLTAQFGSTYGDYVTRLDADASYLGSLGETVTDISQLYGFEIQQADGLSPITQLGGAVDAQVPTPGLSLSFGRSFSPSISGAIRWVRSAWAGPTRGRRRSPSSQTGRWSSRFRAAPSALFQPDSRNAGYYFDQPGDHGTLTPIGGGAFTLTEQDGQVTAFNADGTLNYVQDTNGNRITAGYTSGLLTSLTRFVGPVADDRLQRRRPDRQRDRLRRPPDDLHLRRDRTITCSRPRPSTARRPPTPTAPVADARPVTLCCRSPTPTAPTAISTTTPRAASQTRIVTAAPRRRRSPTARRDRLRHRRSRQHHDLLLRRPRPDRQGRGPSGARRPLHVR